MDKETISRAERINKQSESFIDSLANDAKGSGLSYDSLMHQFIIHKFSELENRIIELESQIRLLNFHKKN